MGETIAQFSKNSSEEVRVCIEEYKGHRLFDIRSYYHNGEEWLPTKKGISLKVELYPEFREAIDKLGQVLAGGDKGR